MSKHTEGPLTTDSSCVIRASNGEEVGRCMSQRYEVAEANARLMAAAPDLLAACEQFAAAMRKREKPDLLALIEALHVADAAIAKAKGEQP